MLDHPESSPAALRESFAEEKRDSDFRLPVRLDGRVKGKNAERSPWSDRPCVGWGLSVEIYRKTTLGGDADYALLERRYGLGEFTLQQDDEGIRVAPPGIVRGPHEHESLIAWDGVDKAPKLKDIVDNAMQVQKLSRKRFTGVRVAEALLEDGDRVTVWGTAAKEGDSVVVKGSATEGDPGALLAASLSTRARARGAGRGTLRIGLNALLTVAALGLGVLVGTGAPWWKLEKAYPWVNVEQVGTLSWTGNGKSYEVSGKTLNLGGTSSWSLDPSDTQVSLVSHDVDAVVKGSTEITLTRPLRSSFTVYPAAPAYPRYLRSQFRFTVPPVSPAVQELSTHQGPFYVVNRTAGEVEVRFRTASTRKALQGKYWSIDPAEKTYLVVSDQRFNLTEGDAALVRRAGESSERDAWVTLGGGGAATWETTGRRWVLTVDEAALIGREGPLVTSNPAQYEVQLEVFDRGGESSLGTWTLASGFGGPQGEALESGGSPFVFKDGYRISVEPHANDLVYRGPLNGYPKATFKDGVWSIGP